MRAVCGVNKPNTQRTGTVGFYSDEVPRVVKFVEMEHRVFAPAGEMGE